MKAVTSSKLSEVLSQPQGQDALRKVVAGSAWSPERTSVEVTLELRGRAAGKQVKLTVVPVRG